VVPLLLPLRGPSSPLRRRWPQQVEHQQYQLQQLQVVVQVL
jgi:hypothetical protein